MSTIKFKNRSLYIGVALIVFTVGCGSLSVGRNDAIYYHAETTYIERDADSASVIKAGFTMNYKRFTGAEADLMFDALQLYEDSYGDHLDDLIREVKAPTEDQRAAVVKRYEAMRDKKRGEISTIKRKIYTLKK